MEIVAQIALNAVIAGAIYSLAALGFNLLYGTTKFFDLGYGAYAAAGAYAVFWAHKLLEFPLIPSILFGIFTAALLGFVVEKTIYRRLRRRKASPTVILIASLGVLTVIQALLAILFSSQFQTLSHAIDTPRVLYIFGGAITSTQVVILAAGLAAMIALGAALRYSMFGKAVRAVSDDEEIAQTVGIPSERIVGIVYVIGCAMGGAAGIAVGFDAGVQPTMGFAILLKGAVAAIIGGIGNIYGGVLGAFLLAALENAGAWHFSGEWKDAIAFGILIAFLLFRPKGLLPK